MKEVANPFKEFDNGILEGNLTWWQMELPSGKVLFGREKTKMLGYSPEDFTHYQDFTKLLHPEDYPLAMDAMKKHLDGKKEYYEASYRIKHKNGKYIRFFDIGKIVNKQKGIITLIGFVFKVDNEKQQKYYSDLIKNGTVSMSELILRIVKD